jgi:bifunctional non-homologous end joining protein LigD
VKQNVRAGAIANVFTKPATGRRASLKAAKPATARKRSEPTLSAEPSRRRDKTSPTAQVAGITLSNPGKLMYPEAGLTKRDLARYYEAVGDWIVPHIAKRPLTLVRCPDGWNGECFYQKHANDSVHTSVDRVPVPERNGSATYFAASSVAAVVGLLQWGVLELHPWSARAPRLNRPDRLIFDFDPDTAVEWNDLVGAVGLLRELLDDLGLEGFLKTTGGKGLHVVVPIRPTLDWEAAKGSRGRLPSFSPRRSPNGSPP